MLRKIRFSLRIRQFCPVLNSPDMFPELNSILSSSPDSFRIGDFIVLSDRQADASFLIHHYLSFYLRARCKVCFLGLVQSFSHYSAVSQRLGVSLTQAREKGQLVFLEGLKDSSGVISQEESSQSKLPLSYLRSPGAGLECLFKFVESSVRQNGENEDGEIWGPPVLLIDDLSVLLSLGVSAGAILDFTLYCQATICSELQGNIVLLVRREEEDVDDEGSKLLQKGVIHQCSLALHVEGLPTGYCRDIHGQMEVWWRSREDAMYNQRKVFHYKVHDKGASFFARGTSSAVL